MKSKSWSWIAIGAIVILYIVLLAWRVTWLQAWHRVSEKEFWGRAPTQQEKLEMQDGVWKWGDGGKLMLVLMKKGGLVVRLQGEYAAPHDTSQIWLGGKGGKFVVQSRKTGEDFRDLDRFAIPLGASQKIFKFFAEHPEYIPDYGGEASRFVGTVYN